MTWCLKPCTCANIFLSLWQRNGAAYHGDSRLDSRDLVPLKRGSGIKKDACFLPHPRHSLSSSEFQALSLFFPIKQLRDEKFRKNAVTETGGKEGDGGVFNCNTLLFWGWIHSHFWCSQPKTNAFRLELRKYRKRAKVPAWEKKKVGGLLKLRPSGSKRVKSKHEPLDTKFSCDLWWNRTNVCVRKDSH